MAPGTGEPDSICTSSALHRETTSACQGNCSRTRDRSTWPTRRWDSSSKVKSSSSVMSVGISLLRGAYQGNPGRIHGGHAATTDPAQHFVGVQLLLSGGAQDAGQDLLGARADR